MTAIANLTIEQRLPTLFLPTFIPEKEFYPLSTDNWLNLDFVVTEDDTPVDNLFSAKNQRLLVESLYSSWSGIEARPYLADTNVGVFSSPYEPPIVPDVFVSLDVRVAKNWREKENRSYFIWKFGKPPDVVIEIVSNREGKEDNEKLRRYAQLGVSYYVIYDPTKQLSQKVLRIYELQGMTYIKLKGTQLPKVKLGVKLWQGLYEGVEDVWLRWCDEQDNLILTGGEQAKFAQRQTKFAEQQARFAQQEVTQERQRTKQERQRAEQEHQRAEQLANLLKSLGYDPSTLKP